MIVNKNGDLLNSKDCTAIIHQTNAMGCGLADGDLDGVVYPMIQEMFENDEDITLCIYEFYVDPFAAVNIEK